MNRKQLIYIGIMVVISCIFIILMMDKPKEKKSLQIYDVFDTYSEITIYADVNSDKVLAECNRLLHELHAKWSYKLAESEIGLLNASAGKNAVEISPETADILKKSIEYAKLTNGYFDITTGSISMLWDIGGENRIPSRAEISNAIQNTGEGILELGNDTAHLTKEKASVSLGGIAKGYAAKCVMDIIKNNNIDYAVVNLGGNVYAMGKDKEGKFPEVGIMDPKSPEKVIGVLTVCDSAVVTSGDYMRYFEKDGVKYHHIMNPYTGMPANSGISSVTIVGKDPIICDVLSTAVFIIGYKESTELIKESGCSAIFVTDNDRVYYTSDLQESFEFVGDGYESKIIG